MKGLTKNQIQSMLDKLPNINTYNADTVNVYPCDRGEYLVFNKGTEPANTLYKYYSFLKVRVDGHYEWELL